MPPNKNTVNEAFFKNSIKLPQFKQAGLVRKKTKESKIIIIGIINKIPKVINNFFI